MASGSIIIDEGDESVANEKYTAKLQVGNAEYTYYPVASIPGSEKLPYSLTVLLENILRCAPDEEAAAELADRLVKAGTAGEAGS